MVTLLGFFCILANVILLEIYIPDLVGPVLPIQPIAAAPNLLSVNTEATHRLRHGCTTALLSDYGCELGTEALIFLPSFLYN